MKKSFITLVACAIVLCAGALVVISAIGWRTIAVGFGSMLQAAGGGVVAGVDKEVEQAKAATENHAVKIPNVNIEVLKNTTLEDTLRLTGTVEAWKEVMLSAEIGGKIEAKNIEEGDHVKEGQVLFQIDTESIRAAYDQAEAQFRLAKQDFDRTQRLVDRGVAAQQNKDSAVANRDVTEASLRSLQIQLNKSIVKAPFDAIVDRIFMEKDEFTDTGKPLVRLVQLDRVKVKVGVPERDVLKFKVGDKVKIALDAMPDRDFDGVISKMTPTADPTTHTFLTEVEVGNAEAVIKPGMIARAELVRGVYPDTIVIPIFASALLDDKRVVFVEENGNAVVRQIETGVVKGSSVQVTAGLKAGDHLIVVGQHDVRPGEPVKVQETLP
ncbi:MAG: efflux RND transporter periplasmic adaptor subunit [Candidatus Hydrogenedentes bacterium]|nr:efflux RND transporter periplasmic adaptor subunit [Candidatus Hydrogenedentota bacterium]